MLLGRDSGTERRRGGREGGKKRRSLLTGGNYATPRCGVAGWGGSPLCLGFSHAGGSVIALGGRSRWPQGHRLCYGDREGDWNGAVTTKVSECYVRPLCPVLAIVLP